MVDDSIDRRFDTPHDYWYSAGQIMLSGPEVHGYADRWADLRGYEIFGRQPQRAYLNRGENRPGHFWDAGASTGLDQSTNARGACLADFDNDGDLDLALTHQFKNLTLYRNDIASPRHWLGLSVAVPGTRVKPATSKTENPTSRPERPNHQRLRRPVRPPPPLRLRPHPAPRPPHRDPLALRRDPDHPASRTKSLPPH